MSTKAQALAIIYEMGRQDGAEEQSGRDRAALAEVLVETRLPFATIAGIIREMHRRAAE